MKEILEQLREELPAVFLGTSASELTGDAICWGTIQNKRSRGEIPDECFLRSGSRVLVVRDPFLDWWASTLRPARQTCADYQPRRSVTGSTRYHASNNRRR
jgi:hypothetical protein